jgi:hypothetical protein
MIRNAEPLLILCFSKNKQAKIVRFLQIFVKIYSPINSPFMPAQPRKSPLLPSPKACKKPYISIDTKDFLIFWKTSGRYIKQKRWLLINDR